MSNNNPIEGTPGQPGRFRGGRPRRPQREVPNYPQSPITISQERQEPARDLLGRVYEMWESGRHYDSLRTWYDAPFELRDDAVNSVLLQEAKSEEDSLRDVQYRNRGKPESLILQHYALLTTPAVGKVVNPEGNLIITGSDGDELASNPGGGDDQKFRTRLHTLELNYQYYYHDEGDFIEPKKDIVRNFSMEEARDFFLKLIPEMDERSKFKLLSAWGIVDPTRYAELLTDPRLADDLERPLIEEGNWGDEHLANFLVQGIYPSVEFFEEAFKRLRTEDSNSSSEFEISVKGNLDVTVPSSVFYFSILRRMVQPRKSGMSTEERKNRIVEYLLNDAYMEHALPYIETDEVYGNELYGDVFVEEGRISLAYQVDIEARGDEAKEIKRKRFGEVLRSAEEYLKEKGEIETIQKLKDREVTGINFADYWLEGQETQ